MTNIDSIDKKIFEKNFTSLSYARINDNFLSLPKQNQKDDYFVQHRIAGWLSKLCTTGALESCKKPNTMKSEHPSQIGCMIGKNALFFPNSLTEGTITQNQ